MIIFGRKFCIDRQPDRRAVFVARKLNCKIDILATLVARLDVARELIGGQKLFEQISQLHFPPAAARLHVRQNFLQTADIARELLHRAETFVHLFQTIAHQLERFAEAFLQRALQFFVDRRAHLVDLLGVVLLRFFQAKIDNRAHTFERFAELFALSLGRRRALLPIPRKFVTQSAIQHFQTSN